ncbi:MAG: hypothetical protein U5R46_16675 [Gammaproteobacteria bacterium]|nr:hypothetical protein [Gammaproteobacteria bacterium]
MIDSLHRIAVRIRPLRHVAVVLGVACLAGLGMIIFGTPASGAGNRFLMPAIVGFIWCLSAYGFIDTFQSVPGRLDSDRGIIARVKRRLYRAWFWFLAALFAVSTLAALFLTIRLGSVWLDTWP